MILYDYILSASCYKVRLMAALLGVPLELKAVNFHPERAHKSPGLLALNPAGTLPIWVDGDRTSADTKDILNLLAEEYGPDWIGEDLACVDHWLDFAGLLNASLGMARLHDMIGVETDIESARRDGVQQLRVLEERLLEQRIDGLDFLCGPAPTIADIACFPNTALAPDGGISLDYYPSIRLWMRAIRALPGFIEMPGIHRLHELRNMPEHQK